MNLKISIIIPVYNRLFELKRAVISVLKQKFAHFELIIVDDGSSIELKSLIKSLNDDRIRYFRNNMQRGVSYSRNQGIKKACHSWIAFLDSDDEWLPGKLSQQLEYLALHPELRVIHTEEIWIRRGKRVNQKLKHKKSGGDIFIPSLNLCLMSPSSIMIKKEIFDQYGFFDEELPACEDYDLWLRITALEKVGFIETPLIIKYGGHADQLSQKYEAMDRFRIKSLLKIREQIQLDGIKKQALDKVLIKKLTLLCNGARKRGKIKSTAYYQSLINQLTDQR